MHNAAIRGKQQASVIAMLPHPLCNVFIQQVIKHNRAVRIFLQLLIGFDAIRHIRIAQNRNVQPLTQLPGVKTLTGFH